MFTFSLKFKHLFLKKSMTGFVVTVSVVIVIHRATLKVSSGGGLELDASEASKVVVRPRSETIGRWRASTQ